MRNLEFILTLIFLLLGCFICILGAAIHQPWIGPAFVTTYTLSYIFLCKPSIATLKVILCITIIGYTVDSLHKLFGFLTFPPAISIGQLPLWFFSVWVLFALSFPTLCNNLKNHSWKAGVVGITTGPLLYVIENKLGVIHFGSNFSVSLLSIAIGWGLMMLVFIKILSLNSTHAQRAIQSNN